MGKPLSLAAAQLQESARLIKDLSRRGVNLLENGLEHRLDDDKILEASLSRIYQHFENDEFAVLTSWRQPQYPKNATPEERADIEAKTKAKNEENFELLRRQINGLGLGHIRILGHGQEEDPNGGLRDVVEPSLVVINKQMSTGEPRPDFLDRMVELGNMYEQWGIVWSSPTEGAHLIQLRDPTMVMDRMPNFGTALRQYYSQLWSRRGDPEAGTFSLHNPASPGNNPRREGLKYVCFPKKPSTLMEMMGLHVLGDVGVLYYESEHDAIADIVAEALEHGH